MEDIQDVPETLTGHRWSGWPGAFCLDCHAEHALENALAFNWFDIGPDETINWKSEDHKRYVELHDGFCWVNTPREKMAEVVNEIYALAVKIGEAQPCPKCGGFNLKHDVHPDLGVESFCMDCVWCSLDPEGTFRGPVARGRTNESSRPND